MYHFPSLKTSELFKGKRSILLGSQKPQEHLTICLNTGAPRSAHSAGEQKALP